MGALADISAYMAALEAPSYRAIELKVNAEGSTEYQDCWMETPNAGAAPTTAVVPTRALAGVFGKLNEGQQGEAASGDLYINRIRVLPHYPAGICSGNLLLYDRLSHQAGLSGTTTGAQTTNLPTAALTRYTDGVGVMACIQCYASVGNTEVNLTCSYTNQAGTAGRTSVAMEFSSSSGAGSIDDIQPLALQQGDTGVRSVESVTLSASTLTAGNFGVTLIRPLAIIPLMMASVTDLTAIQHACNFIKLQSGYALGIANKIGFITTTGPTFALGIEIGEY